jgi:hypothetical protein
MSKPEVVAEKVSAVISLQDGMLPDFITGKPVKETPREFHCTDRPVHHRNTLRMEQYAIALVIIAGFGTITTLALRPETKLA